MKASFYKAIYSIVLPLFFSVLLLGCKKNHKDDLQSLLTNPSVQNAGPVMVIGAMAAAAEYLNMDFDAVSKILKDSAGIVRFSSDSVALGIGQTLLYPNSPDSTLFGELTFENTSGEKAVLFLESFGPNRESQGFSYIKLEPGNKFRYQHNLPPAVVKVVAVVKAIGGAAATKAIVVTGVVILVGGELRALIYDQFSCNLTSKAIMPNVCVGYCTKPSECLLDPGSYKPYGPAWLGMSQPTACVCVP